MRARLSLLLLCAVAACGTTRSANTGHSGVRATSGGAGSVQPAATPDAAVAADASSADASAPAGDGAVDTGRAQQLFMEGAQAFARNDFQAAARGFLAAYQLTPSRELAYNLGRVYERMGEVAQGIQYFERAMQDETDATRRGDIERRIAGLRAYQQRRTEGLAQALPSQDALNQEGVSWFQRGVRFFQRRQYRQALLAFEQASNHLQTPELTYNLGMTYERLGNIPQALDLLRQYLSAREGTGEEQFLRDHIRQLEQQGR